MRDPQAMQAAHIIVGKTKERVIATDIKSRYMTAGSWRASLSKSGQFHKRGSGGGKR